MKKEFKKVYKGKPNPNLIKMGASYTTEDLAKRLRVCRKTIQNWHREGLPAIDDKLPKMFNACDVKYFITQKRARKKFTCDLDEFLCLSCKKKVKAKEGSLNPIIHKNKKCYMLFGRCETCNKPLRKMASKASLGEELEETPENEVKNYYKVSPAPVQISTYNQFSTLCQI
jgi:hypothetical protein